jgi:hypothetical protein
MKIAIMQPYFFPYIGYFQLIASVDKFILLDDANYIKKGWINRNYILDRGKSIMITLPLSKASQNKKIHEIEITADRKVVEKLLKSISMNYRKAPYFEAVFLIIQQIFATTQSSIAEFNLIQLRSICSYLEIPAQIISSSRLYNNTHLKGEIRIIDICIQELADVYINPIGGIDLYHRDMFEKNGIQLSFIKPLSTEYNQFQHQFVPWLSIIDVLMFNSIEQSKEILKQYQLV